MADENEVMNEAIKETPEVESPDAAPLMPEMLGDIGAPKASASELRIKIWILGLVIIVLVAPYYFLYRQGYRSGYDAIFKPGISKIRKKMPVLDVGPMFPLENIDVNLSDQDVPKYISVSIQLELREDYELSECAVREAQLRDIMISFFAKLRSSEIDSISDRNRLKRLIQNVLNATLKRARVRKVYFNQFRVKLLEPEKKIQLEE